MKANVSCITSRPESSDGRDLRAFPIQGADAHTQLDQFSLMELILRRMPSGIVFCSSDGQIIFVNRTAKQMAQIDPEGKPLSMAAHIWGEMYVNRHHIAPSRWPMVKALGGEAIQAQECHLIRSDRSSCCVLISAFPVTADGQLVGCLATLADITAHRRRELALREQAVYQERSRMAADIHDTVAQGFNAIVLQLEAAEQDMLEDPTDAKLRIHKAQDVARHCLQEARRSMWTLSHETFNSEDPSVELSVFARRLFDGTAVKLELSLEEGAHIWSPAARSDLLRIGKEALTNAQRHAQAKTVGVELAYRKHQIRLCVHDDGHGFVRPARREPHHGFGLSGMHDRAKRLGGSIVVESGRGLGTKVVALVPLRPPRAA